MQSHFFLFLLTIALSFQSLAQSDMFLSKIPANPLMLAQINLDKLNNNMSLDKMEEMKLVDNLFSRLFPGSLKDGMYTMTSVDELGLAHTGNAYVTIYPLDNGTGYAYMIPLNGKEKFETYYENVAVELNEEAEISSIGNYSVSPWGLDSWMAWNANSLIHFSVTKNWSPTDYEDLSWEDLQSAEKTFGLEQLEIFLSGNSSTSSTVQKVDKASGAICIWGDYGGVIRQMQNMIVGSTALMGMEGMMDMYKGVEVMMDVNFIPGKALVDMTMKTPEDFPGAQAMTSGKINRKFQKYINGEQLIGAYSFAIDPETYVEATKKMIYRMLDNTPEMMGLGKEIGGLIGMFIDEKAIYNFLKGDLVIAFTGLQQFEKVVTSYQYDEEFNATEQYDTTTSQLPQFTMMMTYGDEENMSRIFSIGQKLGLMIPMSKHYYEVPAPTGGSFYIGKYNDILFVSNDVALMTQKLTTGWGNKKIKKNYWKQMKKNSLFAFWDIPKTLQMADENGIPMDEKMVNMSKESLSKIKIVAPRNQTGDYKTTFSFDFVNQKTNALELIMNFFNSAFFDTATQSSL